MILQELGRKHKMNANFALLDYAVEKIQVILLDFWIFRVSFIGVGVIFCIFSDIEKVQGYKIWHFNIAII